MHYLSPALDRGEWSVSRPGRFTPRERWQCIFNSLIASTFHGQRSLPCSHAHLTSEAINPFRNFGTTPWTGDQPIAIPLPTQNSTRQRKADTHTCLKRDSNPGSQSSRGPRP
jgi:hypothetical protein